MTDTIYGVIVLAVSFAGAVIGTIVLFVGMGIRDALDRRPRSQESYTDNRSVNTMQIAVQGDLHLHVGADAAPAIAPPLPGHFILDMEDLAASAYMPARARGERPAARITAQRPNSLVAALHAIPGAEVRPPLRDHCDAVIVATTNEAFVTQVRDAVRRVRGVDIHLIGGVAPVDRRFDRYARNLYLWAECWRDGEMLLSPEPRKRADLQILRRIQGNYWIVRPAGETSDMLAAIRPAAYITLDQE